MVNRRACIVRQNAYPEDMLVRREAQALQDAGFDVDVICTLSPHSPKEELVDGVCVYRLPPRRKKRGILRYVSEYLGFFALVALKLTTLHLRHPYALVQVNTMPDFLVFATLIPRLLGAKVTLQVYEPMPELWMTKFRFAPLIRLLETIQQLALGYAHHSFTVTQQLKDSLVGRGADPTRITVVLNAPEPRFFQMPTPESAAVPDANFVLICHGVIEERYGHDTMLEAIRLLRPSIPGIRLRILGRGSYLQEFLAQIEAWRLNDCVQYLGFVPLSQLVAELCSADVGIVAQKASPYSHLVHTGKMYDYLQVGKPVIASRLNAVRAYFGEESLCFFTPGDAQDLARAIRHLYENPEARERFARNGQALYEQYQWEKQRAGYLSACRALVSPNTVEDDRAEVDACQ